MDATTTTPALPSPPTRPRRRWLRWALAFAVVAVLGFFGAKSFVDWRMRVAWAEAEAEADRLDPGWRLKEMIAAFEEIPDHENSAFLIRSLAKGHGPNDRMSAGNKHSLLFSGYPPQARLNDAQVKHIEPLWAKLRESIETARKLKDMPRGRWPMENADDWDALSSRPHNDHLLIADWLKHDALLSAQDGKQKLAAESCLAILNAGRSLRDEQGFMMMLYRIAFHQIGIETLERVLAQGDVPEATLRTIQASLEEDMRDNIFLRGARGERNYGHLLFEHIRAGKEMPHALVVRSGGPINWLHRKFPTSLLSYYPERLRQFNEFVEIARLPSHERGPKLTAHTASVAKSGNPLLSDPMWMRFHDDDVENQGLVRSAIVALACERYRLAHEAWPMTLDVLVKEKLLPETPLDPVDGKPLRMRATADGIVIYSIGKNGIDEEGNMRRRNGFPGASDDRGFRLWHVTNRALPPEAPKEDKKKKL